MSSSEVELSKLEESILFYLARVQGRWRNRIVSAAGEEFVYVTRIVRACRRDGEFKSAPEVREALRRLIELKLIAGLSKLAWPLDEPGANVSISDRGLLEAQRRDPSVWRRSTVEKIWIDVGSEFHDGLLEASCLEAKALEEDPTLRNNSLVVPTLLLLHEHQAWVVTTMRAVLASWERDGRVKKRGKQGDGVTIEYVRSTVRALRDRIPGMSVELEGRLSIARWRGASVSIRVRCNGERLSEREVSKVLKGAWALQDVNPMFRGTEASLRSPERDRDAFGDQPRSVRKAVEGAQLSEMRSDGGGTEPS